MKTHPYLRAYMAGVATPSVVVLFLLMLYLSVRAYFPFERILVFPLAVVPALWGVWNVLWVALHGRSRWPLGLHGAIVPLFAVPIGVTMARSIGFEFPVEPIRVIMIVTPLAMVMYYLAWKYIVGFLNELIGVG